jgi:hypothetical protein
MVAAIVGSALITASMRLVATLAGSAVVVVVLGALIFLSAATGAAAARFGRGRTRPTQAARAPAAKARRVVVVVVLRGAAVADMIVRNGLTAACTGFRAPRTGSAGPGTNAGDIGRCVR